MSLRTVGKFAAELDDPANPTDGQQWLDQLVRLVPGEAVIALSAGLAFCAGYAWGWETRWAIFGVIALLSLVYIYWTYWQTLTAEQKHANKFPIPWWALVTGEIAYVGWAVSIPENPFLQWHKWDLKFAPFVSFGVVILLTAADKVHTIWKERRQPNPAPPAPGPTPSPLAH